MTIRCDRALRRVSPPLAFRPLEPDDFVVAVARWRLLVAT
jgi:hypothetical protein